MPVGMMKNWVQPKNEDEFKFVKQKQNNNKE